MDPGSLLLLAVFAGLMFMIFNRGRRQQREAQALQARLVPGVQVMTSSGLHATLVELTEDGIAVLETAPGQHSRWDRRAIARVVDAAHEPEPDGLSEPTTSDSAGTAAPSDRD